MLHAVLRACVYVSVCNWCIEVCTTVLSSEQSVNEMFDRTFDSLPEIMARMCKPL